MLKNGGKYLIEVHGWIMLQKVESGMYRIEISQHKNKLIATFYKPKGKKIIVRHYVDDLMISDINLNRTEILEKLQ